MGKLLLWLHLLPWVKGFKVDSLIIFISLAKVVKTACDHIYSRWQKCDKRYFDRINHTKQKCGKGDVLIKFT